MLKRSLLALGAVVTLGLVLVLIGVIPTTGGGSTHPPCDQLPARSEVETALASNGDLARTIEATGKGVVVGIGEPCDKGSDRALIEVQYSSDEEKEAIEKILQTEDGFGVPLDLVED